MCRYCGRLYGRAASRLTNDRGRALLAKYVSLLPIPGMASWAIGSRRASARRFQEGGRRTPASGRARSRPITAGGARGLLAVVSLSGRASATAHDLRTSLAQDLILHVPCWSEIRQNAGLRPSRSTGVGRGLQSYLATLAALLGCRQRSHVRNERSLSRLPAWPSRHWAGRQENS